MYNNDSAVEITEKEFNEIIDNSHKIVVVDFFAEWCFPCIMLAPVIEEIAENMKNVKFAKINIDDNEELARKYQITNIPCLIVFKDGKEVERIIGNRPSDFIEKKIKGFLWFLWIYFQNQFYNDNNLNSMDNVAQEFY